MCGKQPSQHHPPCNIRLNSRCQTTTKQTKERRKERKSWSNSGARIECNCRVKCQQIEICVRVKTCGMSSGKEQQQHSNHISHWQIAAQIGWKHTRHISWRTWRSIDECYAYAACASYTQRLPQAIKAQQQSEQLQQQGAAQQSKHISSWHSSGDVVPQQLSSW